MFVYMLIYFVARQVSKSMHNTMLHTDGFKIHYCTLHYFANSILISYRNVPK